jgi:hypothetical protein
MQPGTEKQEPAQSRGYADPFPQRVHGVFLGFHDSNSLGHCIWETKLTRASATEYTPQRILETDLSNKRGGREIDQKQKLTYVGATGGSFSDSDTPRIRVTVQASLLQPGREERTDSFNQMPCHWLEPMASSSPAILSTPAPCKSLAATKQQAER